MLNFEYNMRTNRDILKKRSTNRSDNRSTEPYNRLLLPVLYSIILLLRCCYVDAIEGCLELTENERPALFCQHGIAQLPLDNTILPQNLGNLRIIGTKIGTMKHNGILTRINLTGLETLTYLEISNFNLETIISGTFERMRDLRILDLSRNKIITIHSGAFAGVHLVSLTLTGNHGINLSHRAFSNSEILKLHARDCGLREIDYGTISEANIKHLSLSNNKITWLDPKFEELIQPQSHENYLFRSDMSNWGFIDLTHNPLVCDCNLLWLAKIIEDQLFASQTVAINTTPTNQSYSTHPVVYGTETHLMYKLNFTCANPPPLAGRRLPQSWRLFCPIPQIVGIDLSLLSNDLEFAQLTCLARGTPPPSLQWTYQMDGHKVQNTLNPNVNDRHDPKASSLNIHEGKKHKMRTDLYERSIILNVSLSRHRARNFTCTVWNEDNPKAHDSMQSFKTPDHLKTERMDTSERFDVKTSHVIRMHELTVTIRGPQVLPSQSATNVGVHHSGILNNIVQINVGRNDSNYTETSIDSQISSEYNYLYTERFSLIQLLGAIIGTFITTLIILYLSTHFIGCMCPSNQQTFSKFGRTTNGSKPTTHWHGVFSKKCISNIPGKSIPSQSITEKTPLNGNIMIGGSNEDSAFSHSHTDTNRFNSTAGPSTVPLRRQPIPQALLMASVPAPPVDHMSTTPPPNPAYWSMPEYIYTGSVSHEYDVPKPLDTFTTNKSSFRCTVPDPHLVNTEVAQSLLSLVPQYPMNTMNPVHPMSALQDSASRIFSTSSNLISPTNYWTHGPSAMMINPLLLMDQTVKTRGNPQASSTNLHQYPQACGDMSDYPTYLQTRPYPPQNQPLLEMITRSPQWFSSLSGTIGQSYLQNSQVLNKFQIEHSQTTESNTLSNENEQ